MAATVRLQLEPDIVDMDREMRAQERAGTVQYSTSQHSTAQYREMRAQERAGHQLRLLTT